MITHDKGMVEAVFFKKVGAYNINTKPMVEKNGREWELRLIRYQ